MDLSVAFRVHELMRRRPVVSIADLADALELSRPMIAAALGRMRDLKIVREITGRQRHRLFVYGQYLIQAPRVAIEYVVAHELAYLLHRNHSSAFWLKLAETMPD